MCAHTQGTIGMSGCGQGAAEMICGAARRRVARSRRTSERLVVARGLSSRRARAPLHVRAGIVLISPGNHVHARVRIRGGILTLGIEIIELQVHRTIHGVYADRAHARSGPVWGRSELWKARGNDGGRSVASDTSPGPSLRDTTRDTTARETDKSAASTSTDMSLDHVGNGQRPVQSPYPGRRTCEFR